MTTKRKQKAWENTVIHLWTAQSTLELLGQSDEPWADTARGLAKRMSEFIKDNIEPKAAQ